MTYKELQDYCIEFIECKHRFERNIGLYREIIKFKMHCDYFGEYDFLWELSSYYREITDSHIVEWLTGNTPTSKKVHLFGSDDFRSIEELKSYNELIIETVSEFNKNIMGYFILRTRAEEYYNEDSFLYIGKNSIVKGKVEGGEISTKSYYCRINDDDIVSITYSTNRGIDSSLKINSEVYPHDEYKTAIVNWQKIYMPELWI